MSVSKCQKCGVLLLSCGPVPHRCQPAWRVWCVSFHQSFLEGEVVHAYNAQAAAAVWAERSDGQGDYEIVRGEEVEVLVINEDDIDNEEVFEHTDFSDFHGVELPKDLQVYRYVVSGETVPQYYARSVEDGRF